MRGRWKRGKGERREMGKEGEKGGGERGREGRWGKRERGVGEGER